MMQKCEGIEGQLMGPTKDQPETPNLGSKY